jgi:hypothetical protein
MHYYLPLPIRFAWAVATWLMVLPFATEAAGSDGLYQVGAAAVDITPEYPIRLHGFGSRRAESEGITQRIWAKTLAIGTDEEGPIILFTPAARP